MTEKEKTTSGFETRIIIKDAAIRNQMETVHGEYEDLADAEQSELFEAIYKAVQARKINE
jgi:hypothetical protein